MNIEFTNPEFPRQPMQMAGAVVDIVGALAVTGVFAWKISAGSSEAITPLVLVLMVLWSVVARNLWGRRSTWRAEGTDTRSQLRLAERRARASIRRTWRGLVGAWAIIAVVIRWNWHPWLHDPQASVGPILEMAAVIALVHIWTFWNRRQQQRKLQHAQALLEQLSREDGNP